jgi:hypothetical protein
MTVVLTAAAASPQLAWADTVRAQPQLKPCPSERTLADLRNVSSGVESAKGGIQPLLPKRAALPAPAVQSARQPLLRTPRPGLRPAAGFRWPVRVYARRRVFHAIDDPDDA